MILTLNEKSFLNLFFNLLNVWRTYYLKEKLSLIIIAIFRFIKGFISNFSQKKPP